jgi:RNA polymerase sigma factor (sigma-70 family)
MKTKEFKVMNAVKNTVMNTRHELAMANLDLISEVLATNKAVRSCSFLEEEDFAQWGYEVLYKAAKYHKTSGEASYRTYARRALHNNFIDLVKAYEKTIRRKDFSTELYCYTFEEDSSQHEPRDEESIASNSLQESIESTLELENSNQAQNLVRSLIRSANFTEREKTILCNKYDIDLMEEPLATLQLAEKYRMTTQSVNRICRNALDKLRNVPA